MIFKTTHLINTVNFVTKSCALAHWWIWKYSWWISQAGIAKFKGKIIIKKLKIQNWDLNLKHLCPMQGGKTCMECQTSQDPNWAFTALWWWRLLSSTSEARAELLLTSLWMSKTISVVVLQIILLQLLMGDICFDWRLNIRMPFLCILKVQFLNSVKVNCFVHAPIRSR